MLHSLATSPAPTAPTWMMLAPIAASAGRASSRSPASPPTMIANVPAVAPPTPPETGASRNRRPRSLSRAATRCEVPGSIVDMSTQSRPAGGAFDDPAVAEIGGLDIGRGRQHRDHELAIRRRFADRPCPPRTQSYRSVERRRHDIEGDDLEALLDEVGQHRLPHRPGPDKSDLHRCDFPHITR